jgi:hypothetical protein
VKVIIHGPLSARDHLGQMVGFAPDQEVEVDDNDPVAVAWAKGWADTPHGTLVDAPKKVREPEPKQTREPEPPKEPVREPAKEPTPARVETRTESPSGRQRK